MRTDVEFNTIGMEESVNKMRNQAWGMDE